MADPLEVAERIVGSGYTTASERECLARAFIEAHEQLHNAFVEVAQARGERRAAQRQKHVTRANLALVQMRRLKAEADRTTDLERLRQIMREMEVIHDSTLTIREEQLLEEERNETLEGMRQYLGDKSGYRGNP